MRPTFGVPALVLPPTGAAHRGEVLYASPSATTVYLSGSSNPHTRAAARFREDLGLLTTYRSGYGKQIREGRYRIWAVDNGIYSKQPWDERRWWRFVTGLPRGTGRCLFVTAPDVLFDAAGTLDRSAAWLPRIRAAGFPAALVAQDGVEELLTGSDWAGFDALFIGGTDTWKESAAVVELMAEARRRGKWTHVGRVNTRRRLWPMAAGGADSVDGTKVAAGNDRNLPQLLGWLSELRTETFTEHQEHRFVPVRGLRRGPAGPGDQPGAAGPEVLTLTPRHTRRLVRAAGHVEALLTDRRPDAPAGGPVDIAADPHAVAAFRTLLTAARAALDGGTAVVTRASGWPVLPAEITRADPDDLADPLGPVQLSLFPAADVLGGGPRPAAAGPTLARTA